MSLPNDINLSTFEKMNSMKNMFGNSIIEILKPNIKTHQNESVIKMLEITKDKPETFLELLSVAIFHKNIEIIKYMVEKFKITEVDSPFMNALSFHNSIFPENSEFKLNEAKENYNLIQCPFVIMCGIGGDIEIYKYLLKNKLISNKKETGIVGLSKKIKNEFSSNIIGACCYYGRAELLEYLLKNDKYDINIQTSERKSKSGTKVGFYREYSGLTPAMLSIVGPIKDEDTVKILKILNNNNCKFKGCDFYKDNLLHLATKNKKIETAKYLVDELNLKYLLDENNKDNYTPMTLAQHLNNEIFINYFHEKEKVDEKEIEENLKELINESNMIKDKNNKNNKKKKKNNEPINIDLSEYQETLKEIKTNKNKKYKYKNEKEEDDYFQSDNNINKKIKNKKYQENDDYIVGSNSDKLRALLENPKHKKKKEKKENNIYNKDLNSYENEIKGKKIAVEIKEVEVQEIKEINDTKEIKNNKNENTKHEEEDEDYIIGLGSKNKKNKKHKKNINKEEKEKEEEEKMKQKLEEERLKKEEEEKLKQKELEEEIKRKQREKELEEERKREELRKIEEEKEKEKERIKKLKEEEDRKRKIKEEEERKRREEEEIKLKKKLEEEKRKQKELKEQKEKEEEKKEINEESEESDEEDYSSEKNFLSDQEEESQEKSKEKEKEGTKKYISKEDYDKLNKKYLELERRISILEKEKEEMSSLMRTLFLQNKTNMHIPLSANKEENINDLMNLANKELENKNKIINELEGKVSKLNLNNVNEFSADKLKEYKDFYSKQLKTINDALKKY